MKGFLSIIFFLGYLNLAIPIVVAQQLDIKNIPVTYSIQLPDTVHAGKEVTFTTRLAILPGWHIYAPTDVNAQQGMVEAGLWFEVPKGISLTDPPKWPEPEGDGGYEVYRDSIRIRQKLYVNPDCNSGEFHINSTLRWQACEKYRCLAPQTKKIKATIYIKSLKKE